MPSKIDSVVEVAASLVLGAPKCADALSALEGNTEGEGSSTLGSNDEAEKVVSDSLRQVGCIVWE